MAATIEAQRPDTAIEIIGEDDAPGTFDVVADGVSLWNKHEMNAFPEHAEVVAKLPPPKTGP